MNNNLLSFTQNLISNGEFRVQIDVIDSNESINIKSFLTDYKISGIFYGKFFMKRLYFKPNTKVIEEGDLGDWAYIVEAGSLEVSKINDQNNKQVLGRLKENDIFGELGLIDGLPRSATVTALEDCTIKVLTKDSFNSLAKNRPEALMPIFKVLASRLRSTLKQVIGVPNHG